MYDEKWNVSVGIRLSIDYDDIEADSQEEAENIAKDRVLEDIDFNNADLDGITVYCAYPVDNEEEKDGFTGGVDRCISCGTIIPEGRLACRLCECK